MHFSELIMPCQQANILSKHHSVWFIAAMRFLWIGTVYFISALKSYFQNAGYGRTCKLIS